MEPISETTFEERRKKEFENKAKVVELLNSLGKTLIPNYTTLQYTIHNDSILFNMAEERLRYIQFCLEIHCENSLAYLSCFAYKALFLDTETFKVDEEDEQVIQNNKDELYNLNERLNCFGVILDVLAGKENVNQARIFDKLLKTAKIAKFHKLLILLNKIIQPTDFFIFLGLVVLYYQDNLFNEVLLRKIQASLDVIIDFTFEDVSNLSFKELVDELYDIFECYNENKVELIHLSLRNRHIIKTDLSNDEIIEVLEGLTEENNERKKKLMNKIKVKKEENINLKNNNIIANEDDLNRFINCGKNENGSISNTECDKKPEKLDKETKEVNTKDKEEETIESLGEKIKRLQENLMNYEQSTEAYKKENGELWKSNEELWKSNGELWKKLNKYANENEEYKKRIDKFIEDNKTKEKEIKSKMKKINKLENQLGSLNLINTNIQNELINIKFELKNIKIRDGLKAMIDYIYSSLKIKDSLSYKKKIDKIYDVLKKDYSSIEYDKNLIKNINNFLYKISKKLEEGNESAHEIDLNRSIMEQIIDVLKQKSNDNTFDYLKTKFKVTNADQILKELMINRRNNYYMQEKLIENEKEIKEKITDLKKILKIEENRQC